MKRTFRYFLAAASFALVAGAAQADDIQGAVEKVDASAQTVTVQGITFHTSPQTKYKDGLNGFDDLTAGQRVEVDFKYVDGRHHATEIELDD